MCRACSLNSCVAQCSACLFRMFGVVPGPVNITMVYVCRYFQSRFPGLLLAVYFFALANLRDDQNLVKYWTDDVADCQPFAMMFVHHHPAVSKQSAAAPSSQPQQQRPAARDGSALAESAAGDTPSGAPSSSGVVVGYAVHGGEEPLHQLDFPKRPGKQPCDFFIKTGFCKFMETCCFDHPSEFGVMLTVMDLPYRPEQPVCAFYVKQNACKFGASCKFHHPRLVPVYAGSAAAQQAI